RRRARLNAVTGLCIGPLGENAVASPHRPARPSAATMPKHSWFSLALALAACGGGKANTERYAVGTSLSTGSVLTVSPDCKFDAPPGVLDGSKILAPGVIKETCPSGVTTTITAEYADHVALGFPKKAKVGEELYFRFELRNAKDQELTPTLSEMGDTKLAEG